MVREFGWRQHRGIRPWVAYFFFNGWGNLNLGVSLCLYLPNVEIHVPFGFFRIGREASFRLIDGVAEEVSS